MHYFQKEVLNNNPKTRFIKKITYTPYKEKYNIFMFLLECCRTITKTALLEKIKILYNYIMTTLATRRGYRGKSKRSLCRKKTVRKCRKVKGCKNTKKTAKKSRYCRKRHNKRLVRGGVSQKTSDRATNATNCMTECCAREAPYSCRDAKRRGACFPECVHLA
jgi:hypothetical protein